MLCSIPNTGTKLPKLHMLDTPPRKRKTQRKKMWRKRSSRIKKLLRLLNACNANAQPSIKPLHAVISWVQYRSIHSNDKTFIFSISCACHFLQNHALISFPFDILLFLVWNATFNSTRFPSDCLSIFRFVRCKWLSIVSTHFYLTVHIVS